MSEPRSYAAPFARGAHRWLPYAAFGSSPVLVVRWFVQRHAEFAGPVEWFSTIVAAAFFAPLVAAIVTFAAVVGLILISVALCIADEVRGVEVVGASPGSGAGTSTTPAPNRGEPAPAGAAARPPLAARHAAWARKRGPLLLLAVSFVFLTTLAFLTYEPFPAGILGVFALHAALGLLSPVLAILLALPLATALCMVQWALALIDWTRNLESVIVDAYREAGDGASHPATARLDRGRVEAVGPPAAASAGPGSDSRDAAAHREEEAARRGESVALPDEAAPGAPPTGSPIPPAGAPPDETPPEERKRQPRRARPAWAPAFMNFGERPFRYSLFALSFLILARWYPAAVSSVEGIAGWFWFLPLLACATCLLAVVLRLPYAAAWFSFGLGLLLLDRLRGAAPANAEPGGSGDASDPPPGRLRRYCRALKRGREERRTAVTEAFRRAWKVSVGMLVAWSVLYLGIVFVQSAIEYGEARDSVWEMFRGAGLMLVVIVVGVLFFAVPAILISGALGFVSDLFGGSYGSARYYGTVHLHYDRRDPYETRGDFTGRPAPTSGDPAGERERPRSRPPHARRPRVPRKKGR